MQDQNTPYKCECGETFTGKFCPNCGAMRKEEKTFTCDCGYTGIAKNFCPECGKKLLKRSGRYGEFIGCSGFPKCRFTCSVEELPHKLKK